MPQNPYRPGAGTQPSYLAGRDKVINDATKCIKEAIEGGIARHTIYYGLRGVGKTVLLNKIEEIAELNNAFVSHIEVKTSEEFVQKLILVISKFIMKMSIIKATKVLLQRAAGVLKSFAATWKPSAETITLGLDGERLSGIADSGDYESDLVELFYEIGQLAKNCKKIICLFFDEMQDLSERDLSALIVAIHRANQSSSPIIVFGAGLPTILRKSSEAKSYAERLFIFTEISGLIYEDSIDALVKPANGQGVRFSADAMHRIIKITEGYPYFIQEYGYRVWDTMSNGEITINGVNDIYPEYINNLDKSFYQSRHDRTTPAQKLFLSAMADCESVPCAMSDVAIHMNRNLKSISPHRAALISMGLIYAPTYGMVAFTVPQFGQFIIRRKQS